MFRYKEITIELEEGKEDIPVLDYLGIGIGDIFGYREKKWVRTDVYAAYPFHYIDPDDKYNREVKKTGCFFAKLSDFTKEHKNEESRKFTLFNEYDILTVLDQTEKLFREKSSSLLNQPNYCSRCLMTDKIIEVNKASIQDWKENSSTLLRNQECGCGHCGHTWTYQTLLYDITKIDLNSITPEDREKYEKRIQGDKNEHI